MNKKAVLLVMFVLVIVTLIGIHREKAAVEFDRESFAAAKASWTGTNIQGPVQVIFLNIEEAKTIQLGWLQIANSSSYFEPWTEAMPLH